MPAQTYSVLSSSSSSVRTDSFVQVMHRKVPSMLPLIEEPTSTTDINSNNPIRDRPQSTPKPLRASYLLLAILLNLLSVGTPTEAVELNISPSNLLVVRNVEEIEAVDVVFAAAHTAKPPLPQALVAVYNVDLAGLDVPDGVLLHAFEPGVAAVDDVGIDLQREGERRISILLHEIVEVGVETYIV